MSSEQTINKIKNIGFRLFEIKEGQLVEQLITNVINELNSIISLEYKVKPVIKDVVEAKEDKPKVVEDQIDTMKLEVRRMEKQIITLNNKLSYLTSQYYSLKRSSNNTLKELGTYQAYKEEAEVIASKYNNILRTIDYVNNIPDNLKSSTYAEDQVEADFNSINIS